MVVTDVVAASSTDGSATPAGEPDDDFFSSWDKPSIRRPTPPISRSATPSATARAPSPFLNPGANGNGTARPKSPLVNAENVAAPTGATASRSSAAAAARKSNPANGPRKTSVLGAKKTQKLGAKKIAGADSIDFEAAEKKAKEEADRIEKLGYDPEAEEVAAGGSKVKAGSASADSGIVSPTPLSPSKTFGASKGRERGSGEVERLGVNVARLGFGQVGGGAKAAAAPRKMGFGATAGGKASNDGASPSFCSGPPS